MRVRTMGSAQRVRTRSLAVEIFRVRQDGGFWEKKKVKNCSKSHCMYFESEKGAYSGGRVGKENIYGCV